MMPSTITEITFPQDSYAGLREAKPAENSGDFAQILEKQKPVAGDESKEKISSGRQSERQEDPENPQENGDIPSGYPGSSSVSPAPPPAAEAPSATNFAKAEKGNPVALPAQSLQAENAFFSSENSGAEESSSANLAKEARGDSVALPAQSLQAEKAGEAIAGINSFLTQETNLSQAAVPSENWANPDGETGRPVKNMGPQSQGKGGTKHPPTSPDAEDSAPWAVQKDEIPSNSLNSVESSKGEAGKEGLFSEGNKDEGFRILQSSKADSLESFGRIMEGGERSYITSDVAKEEGASSKNPLHLINNRGEVPQQVGQRFIWSLAHGEEKIRMTLDPPELGNVYLEIHREKENVRAVLLTDNQMAKTVLESHQFEIQKIIEKEGFTLEKFDVFVDQQMGFFQENREWTKSPESATSNLMAEAYSEPGNDPAAPLQVVRSGGGGLRSIDLII